VTLIAAFALGGDWNSLNLKSELKVVPDNSSVSVPSDAATADLPSSNVNASIDMSLLAKNDSGADEKSDENVEKISNSNTNINFHAASDVEDVYEPLLTVSNSNSPSLLNTAADKNVESGPEVMIVVLFSVIMVGGFYVVRKKVF
jgi:hypothetical protein